MYKEDVNKLSDDIFAYTITGHVTPETLSEATGVSVGDVIMLQSESTGLRLKRSYELLRAYMDDIMEEE